MQITRFTPDDDAAVRAYVDVSNAILAHDCPWIPRRTVRSTVGALTHGWDGEPNEPYLCVDDGVPVAVGSIKTSERDNLHLAWLGVDVHPGHRRHGHGTALLEALTAVAADRGRTSLGAQAWDDGRGGEAFGLQHGFTVGSVAVNRGQHLPDVDPALIDRIHAEAAAAAADYELVRWPTMTPEADLPALADLTAAINDAPTDDLDLEDEVFDAARVHAYEVAHEARGIRVYRVVARHRGTGELAGQTVVAVDQERREHGEQHDTSVVRTHRGHRLGAFLKTGMLHWLREEEPALEWIHTWNAESNGFMVGVNEQLGYQVLGRELDFQKTL